MANKAYGSFRPSGTSGMWSNWLEEEPTALYGQYTTGQSPWQRYFADQYSNVRRQYMGALAGQAMGGGMPNLTWAKFMSDFPWLEQFYRVAPRERGERRSIWAPGMKWLV